MQRKERLEEEFGLASEEEAFADYAHVAEAIAVNYSLIADELSLLGVFSKGKCLDIGSGLGDLALEVAKRYPQMRVIGVDISPSALGESSKRAGRAGLPNAGFIAADAHALSFKDSSCDLVVSHGALHHLKDPERVFSHIYRVLKPKGLAYISDLKRDAPEELVKEVSAGLPASSARGFINSVNASYTSRELEEMLSSLAIADFKVEGQKFSRQTVIKNIAILRKASARKSDYNLLSHTVLIRK